MKNEVVVQAKLDHKGRPTAKLGIEGVGVVNIIGLGDAGFMRFATKKSDQALLDELRDRDDDFDELLSNINSYMMSMVKDNSRLLKKKSLNRRK